MARRKYKADRKLYERKIKIMGADGIERRKSIYAPTIAELDAKEIKMIEDNKKGLKLNENRTIGEYAADWLDIIRDKCADNTYLSYMYSVKHIQDTIGTIKLTKLKKKDIQMAIDSFISQPRTAQIYRMTLKRICEDAVDNEIIARNPCKGVVLPTYKAKEKRALTQIEMDAIEAADLDAEERLFVSLLYYTGMRRGEILALGRRDIDLKRGVLTVNRSLAFLGNRGVLKDPKTAKSRRELPIHPELQKLLQVYRYDLYLFTRNGDFFTQSTYTKMWARILGKLNMAAGGGTFDRITDLTAHIFRHNYATLLYKQGIDVRTAQQLLGHASIKVTADIYQHLDKTLNQDTINAVNEAFTARRA